MKTLYTVALGLVLASLAHAQGASPVTIATPSIPEVKQFFYDSSNNLQYICVAKQKAGSAFWKRSDSTLTNVIVLTNVGTATTATAHYLYPGARVVATGATVDADLNATYTVLTTPTSTTFTFATVSVTNATYTDAGLVLTTEYPLLNSYLWAIQALQYTSTTLIGSLWADSNVAYNHQCSARATY